MRFTYYILIICLLSGCQGLDRLMNESEHGPTEVTPITDAPQLGQPPVFDIPIPEGYKREVYYGFLPIDNKGQVETSPGSFVDVFINQPQLVNQWFKLENTYSKAYWYTYDKQTGIVSFQGSYKVKTIYCVYQYIKEG